MMIILYAKKIKIVKTNKKKNKYLNLLKKIKFLKNVKIIFKNINNLIIEI